MSKKVTKSAPKPPTVITLTLPDGDELIRSGTLLIQRGDLAAIRQFTYSDLTGITRAIQEAAAHLIRIEADSPPAFNAPTVSTPMTPAPQPEVAPVEADPVDTEAEVEIAADASVTPTKPSEDPRLFTLSLF